MAEQMGLEQLHEWAEFYKIKAEQEKASMEESKAKAQTTKQGRQRR